MLSSDWSSDVCSSDLNDRSPAAGAPFATKGRALGFDVGAIDRRALRHRTRPCQGIEQLRPEPPPRPAVEAVVDRRRWSIVCRTVAPPAAGFQYMKDAR